MAAPVGENVKFSNGSAIILSRYSLGATPVVTCGWKLSPDDFGTKSETYVINSGRTLGSSGVVTNAAEVPVFTANGVTASITCNSSLINSGIGLMTMPERPRLLSGM